MRREKTGKDLIEEAKKFGVSLHGAIANTKTFPGTPRYDIIQQRVRDAKRARRESSLWIIALISTIASVISAIAAWFAVTR